MAPVLRIPARLDMNEFRQNVAEARSKVSEATDFMVRQLEKTAAKSAIFDLPRLIQNSDGARQITQRAVQAIASDVGKLTGGAVNAGLPTVLDGVAQSARMSATVLTTVAIPAARGLAEAWVPIIARAAALYLAFQTVQSVIAAVSREVELLSQVAEKARDRGLSPETFQAFVAAAKGAIDVVQTLESALDTFFQANKRRVDDSVSPLATDTEKEKWTELSRTIREIRFEMDGISEGPRTFLNAGADMNKQLLGVVQTLRELDRAGQNLVALDLAEKAFGSKLADNLRTGKITIEEIANTVQQKLMSGVAEGTIFSNSTVQRAKEIDDQLKAAWRTVDQNLRPSMEALDNIALDIKSAWVTIVKLIGEGAAMLGGLSKVSGPSGESQVAQFRNVETTLQSALRDKGLTDQQRRGKEEQLRAIQAKIAQAEANLVPEMPIMPANYTGQGGDVPLPRRRPVNVPETKAGSAAADTASDFDRTTDSINRHIAALNADAAAVGATKTQQEALRAEMQLLQAIQRDDGEVTQAQIDNYAQLRASMGAQEALAASGIQLNREHAQTFTDLSDRFVRASNRLEGAKNAYEGVNDAVRFFGNSTVTALSNINAQTKGIDLLRSAVGDLSREFIRAALTGEGAFAKILGFASESPGSVGGIFGAIAGLFRAEGGPVVSGQPYIVGERGPELFVPGASGQVVPNAALRSPSIVPAAVNGRDSAPYAAQPIILHTTIDARGADQAAVARIGASLEQMQRTLPTQIATVVKTQQTRGTRP